jgi:D-alanyl-D-alanine carboxypeptidase
MQFLDKYNHSNKGQKAGIEIESRRVRWESTNFMLGQPGYIGCKTGITEAAGPCLSAVYQKDGFYFVMILLNSKSMEERWREVPQLADYARAKSGRVSGCGTNAVPTMAQMKASKILPPQRPPQNVLRQRYITQPVPNTERE